MKTATQKLKAALVGAVMALSFGLWLTGFLNSPYTSPGSREQRRYVERYIQENSPDLEQIRLLAEAYWARYPDVESDRHFGKKGIMGIHGARNHYDQHGRIEGRKWGP